MSNKISILSTMPLEQPLLNKALDNNIVLDTKAFIQVIDISDETEVWEKITAAYAQQAIVVFTSASAVFAVCEHPSFVRPDWKIFCIEKATKKAVLQYFDESYIVGSAKDSDELAQKIRETADVKEVIFFCGDKRMDTLPSILLKSGIITNEIVVYKTVEQPTFIEKEHNGILFYSPSGVSSYFSMNTANPGTVLFAIGNTTAAAIKLETENEIVVCPTPSKEALLDVAIDYFNKQQK